jgi:hypothetical protein
VTRQKFYRVARSKVLDVVAAMGIGIDDMPR